MSEQNKKMVRQFFEAVWNEGDLALIDEYAASDIVGHSSIPTEGPEGGKQLITMIRSAFPDYHLTVEDAIAEADKVVLRWTSQGTHRGAFQGIPPTGKEVTFSGITIWRVAGGKLVEVWTTMDMLGLMQQLGAVPTPGAV